MPRSTDKLHARFFQLTDELFAAATPEGKIVEMNDAWATTLGFSGDALRGQSYFERLDPEDYPAVGEIIAALLSGDVAVARFVARLIHADGRTIPFEWSGVYDQDSGLLMTLGHNISNRLDLQRRFNNFFEVALEMMCVTGTDGYFKQLNPQWERVLGWTREELMSRPFVEFVHPDDRALTMAEAAKLGEGGHQTIGFVNRYECKDGSWKWLHWSAALEPEAGVLVATARDVTEQREQKRRLVEAAEETRRANEAKSQFLANMSHELRTPLNSIIGFSNILIKNKQGNLQANDLQFLSRVRDNGRHLLDLINDVLDISKIESGYLELNTELTDLEALLAEVRRVHEPMAHDKQVDLRVDLPSAMTPMRIDRLRLRQVLLNLVANAIKFTDRGKVTLKIDNHPDSRSPARISVVDSGIGIPADKLELVFQPFQQADGTTARKYGGTGLGLSISRSLCERMGFRLWVESRVDEGTTFSIEIPLPDGPETEAEADLASGAVPELLPTDDSRRSVLVIDDDADARELLRHLLVELGCQVRVAGSANEGLRVARGWRPDLITVDLMMPGTHGWEFLQAVRDDALLGAIPVAVVSMVAEENRASLVGAFEIVNKPIARDDLQRVLSRLAKRPGKALVVDDNPDFRRILCELLEAEGVTVAEAPSGADGLAALASFSPDVIILDLMMPAMDGREFLVRLDRVPRYAGVPVIVVTARDLDERERESLRGRATAVLQKGERLRLKLQDALAGIAVNPEAGRNR